MKRLASMLFLVVLVIALIPVSQAILFSIREGGGSFFAFWCYLRAWVKLW